MYQTTCKNGTSTLYVGYDDFTNTIEIHVGNTDGFRFIHIDKDQINELTDILNELKNEIL